MSTIQISDRTSAGMKKAVGGSTPRSNMQSGSTVNGAVQKVYLLLSKFQSISEVDMIKRELAKGNVVFLDFSEFLEEDTNEMVDLKRAIEQLRGYCQEIGGDIGRIGEQLLILTPNRRIKIF